MMKIDLEKSIYEKGTYTFFPAGHPLSGGKGVSLLKRVGTGSPFAKDVPLQKSKWCRMHLERFWGDTGPPKKRRSLNFSGSNSDSAIRKKGNEHKKARDSRENAAFTFGNLKKSQLIFRIIYGRNF